MHTCVIKLFAVPSFNNGSSMHLILRCDTALSERIALIHSCNDYRLILCVHRARSTCYQLSLHAAENRLVSAPLSGRSLINLLKISTSIGSIRPPSAMSVRRIKCWAATRVDRQAGGRTKHDGRPCHLLRGPSLSVGSSDYVK